MRTEVLFNNTETPVQYRCSTENMDEVYFGVFTVTVTMGNIFLSFFSERKAASLKITYMGSNGNVEFFKKKSCHLMNE